MIYNTSLNIDSNKTTKANNASSLPPRLIPKRLQNKLPYNVGAAKLTVDTTNDAESSFLSFTSNLCESPTQSVASSSSSKHASFDGNSQKTSNASTTSIKQQVSSNNHFQFYFHYPPSTTPGSAASSSSLHSSNSNATQNLSKTPSSAPVINEITKLDVLIKDKARRKNAIISSQTSFSNSFSNVNTKTIENTQNNVFSFRKTSIAKFCSKFRRSSLSSINISNNLTKTKDSDDENSLQKQEVFGQNDINLCEQKISTTQMASRAVRKKFSSAKLALRKISQSSLSGLRSGNNQQESLNQSPEIERGLANEKLNSNGSLSSLIKRSLKETIKIKKSLGASLSWDLEQRYTNNKIIIKCYRSRTSSTKSRSRIHSDGSDDNALEKDSFDLKKRRKSSTPAAFRELYTDRLKLEHTCLHCQLGLVHRRNVLQAKLEMAVKLHSRRLEPNRPLVQTTTTGSWPRVDSHSHYSITHSEVNIPAVPKAITRNDSQNRQSMGTPDIVVSSISSDDEYTESIFLEKVDVTVSIRPAPLNLERSTNSTEIPSPLLSSEISTARFKQLN